MHHEMGDERKPTKGCSQAIRLLVSVISRWIRLLESLRPTVASFEALGRKIPTGRWDFLLVGDL